METAAAKIARLDRSIARTGESVTLQRTAVDAGGAVTVVAQLTVPAHIRDSSPQDLLAPGVVECRIVLSSTQLLAPTQGSPATAYGLPRTDDRIEVHGQPHNLQTIAPIYYGGQLVRVNLLSRGGGG